MMRDGIVGVVGTSSTILLQEISLWLSITCALVTLSHFVFVFKDLHNQRKKDARIRKTLREEKEKGL